jgi:hypothetical protein
MRIFAADNGKKVLDHRLPFDDAVPPAVPDELRSLLQDAPTLSGAAFTAQDLSHALAAWKISVGEVQHSSDSGEEDLDIMFLPLLLLLGRDLTLLDHGLWHINVQ